MINSDHDARIRPRVPLSKVVGEVGHKGKLIFDLFMHHESASQEVRTMLSETYNDVRPQLCDDRTLFLHPLLEGSRFVIFVPELALVVLSPSLAVGVQADTCPVACRSRRQCFREVPTASDQVRIRLSGGGR